MEFNERIKSVRKDRGLTQEQFAEKLLVTRQAVSNWENGRNLPDIEMLIMMAKTFDVSLDDLILGDRKENDMAENMAAKLISDGSEVRKAKFNVIGISIGAAMLLISMALVGIKACSVEYIDPITGLLHENFFLLPMAALFLFAGVAAFLITGVRNIVMLVRNSEPRMRNSRIAALVVCGIVIVLLIAMMAFLISGNSVT